MANFVNKHGKYHNKGISYSEGDDRILKEMMSLIILLTASDFDLNLGLYKGSNYNQSEGFTPPSTSSFHLRMLAD